MVDILDDTDQIMDKIAAALDEAKTDLAIAAACIIYGSRGFDYWDSASSEDRATIVALAQCYEPHPECENEWARLNAFIDEHIDYLGGSRIDAGDPPN